MEVLSVFLVSCNSAAVLDGEEGQTRNEEVVR